LGRPGNARPVGLGSGPRTGAPTLKNVQRSAIPFLILGGVSVIVGGLLSAAAAPAPSYTASWAVAYIVLVAGVAQLVLGLGQARLAPHQPSARVVAVEAIAFNLAHVAVLLGTVIGSPWIVDVGAALIVVALGLFIWSVRGVSTGSRWVLYGFRAVILIVLITTPIGVILAHLKG
jgi:putative Mn2+ efflux pump MntP